MNTIFFLNTELIFLNLYFNSYKDIFVLNQLLATILNYNIQMLNFIMILYQLIDSDFGAFLTHYSLSNYPLNIWFYIFINLHY